jgi:hypothetical protein
VETPTDDLIDRLEDDLSAVEAILDAMDGIAEGSEGAAASIKALLDERFDPEPEPSDLVGASDLVGNRQFGAGEQQDAIAEPQARTVPLDPASAEVGEAVAAAPEMVLEAHDDPAVGHYEDVTVADLARDPFQDG